MKHRGYHQELKSLDRLSNESRLRPSDDPGRDETEEERDDRNLVELVQELRVGALGVQVLFGFLLSLPFFAVRFGQLTEWQRVVYVVDLLLAALATALFSGPVAYHRLIFRHHRKNQLVRIANVFAISGLATVAFAICGSVLLAVSYVLHGVIVPLIVALTFTVFAYLWFVLPLVNRGRPNR